MSTISAASSAGNAWADLGARASARKERMFAKTDADGSGTVDKTELQGLLDDISGKTGQALGNADDLMKKMDADGSGGLTSDELDAGMKSLMPAPSSTVGFAQQRMGGPPPADAPTGSSGAASSSDSSTADPLDTNGDGTVSAQERAVGELKDMLDALASAMDADGDKTVSQTEADGFKRQISALVEMAMKQYGAASGAQADATSSAVSVSA